jgi:hypothetical protein
VILSDYPSGLVSGALIPSAAAIRMRVLGAARYYIRQHQHQDSRQSDCSQHAIATRLHPWKRGAHAKTWTEGSAQSESAPRYDPRTPLFCVPPQSHNHTSAHTPFTTNQPRLRPVQNLPDIHILGYAALFCLPQHSNVFCCYSKELRTLYHLTCQEKGITTPVSWMVNEHVVQAHLRSRIQNPIATPVWQSTSGSQVRCSSLAPAGSPGHGY